MALTINIVRGTSKEQLYNGLIGKYHYLGYFQGSSEQLKYVISTGGRQLATDTYAQSFG